jgi:hypothetical protein
MSNRRSEKQVKLAAVSRIANRERQPSAVVPEPATTVVPHRDHAFYNGPVCIGPPDGAMEFDDAGVEEYNVLHGPLCVRGRIKLDAAAAVSLFHELYDRDSEEVGTDTPAHGDRRSLLPSIDWDKLKNFLSKPKPAPEQPAAPILKKQKRSYVLKEGLSWNPLKDNGLSLDASPFASSVRKLPVCWVLPDTDKVVAPDDNKPGLHDWLLSSATNIVVHTPHKKYVVRFRGKVSFAYPDPIGNRSLSVVRRSDGREFLAGTTPAVPSLRGRRPSSLTFDIQIESGGLEGKDEFSFWLHRSTPGGLALVKTDSYMTATVVLPSK